MCASSRSGTETWHKKDVKEKPDLLAFSRKSGRMRRQAGSILSKRLCLISTVYCVKGRWLGASPR